jgi:hypothetical protein
MGWQLRKFGKEKGYRMWSTVVDAYISPNLKDRKAVRTWVNKQVTRSKDKAFIFNIKDDLVGEIFRSQLQYFLGKGEKEITRKQYVDLIAKRQFERARGEE